jgi:DNA modification methylase
MIRADLRQGHVLDVLRAMPDESVHCIVTSPPYWGLRDYGTEPQVWGGEPECEHAAWGDEVLVTGPAQAQGVTSQRAGRSNVEAQQQRGTSQGAFCASCSAWRGSLGLEPTPELYVEHLVAVFREVRRVLRSDGTCWLNLGDSYHSGDRGGYRNDSHRWMNSHMQAMARGSHMETVSPNRRPQVGLKDKDLCGIPWRVAFALQADGWWLRSDIVWAKPNPMPESVTDRPTKSHEYVFLLSKSAHYYYDAEAVKEPAINERMPGRRIRDTRETHGTGGGNDGLNALLTCYHNGTAPTSRNLRSVWTIATEPYPEAHFATFPQALVRPCVLAGTSERGCCATCGAPWERLLEKDGERPSHSGSKKPSALMLERRGAKSLESSVFADGMLNTYRTSGWCQTCAHYAAPTAPCIVLDPFAGSGTTLKVAASLGGHSIGIELNPSYVRLAEHRTAQGALL